MSGSFDPVRTDGSSPVPAKPLSSTDGGERRDADLRVPTRRVKAMIRLRGEEPRPIFLHLGERARHGGAERPSDLLAGGRDFLPADTAAGAVQFVSTHAISVLTVPAELERDPAGEKAATSDLASESEVALHLDDGSRLDGRVRFLPPPGQGRLLDLLNGPSLFLALRANGSVHLVNKRHVAWITALSETP